MGPPSNTGYRRLFRKILIFKLDFHIRVGPKAFDQISHYQFATKLSPADNGSNFFVIAIVFSGDVPYNPKNWHITQRHQIIGRILDVFKIILHGIPQNRFIIKLKQLEHRLKDDLDNQNFRG